MATETVGSNRCLRARTANAGSTPDAEMSGVGLTRRMWRRGGTLRSKSLRTLDGLETTPGRSPDNDASPYERQAANTNQRVLSQAGRAVKAFRFFCDDYLPATFLAGGVRVGHNVLGQLLLFGERRFLAPFGRCGDRREA